MGSIGSQGCGSRVYDVFYPLELSIMAEFQEFKDSEKIAEITCRSQPLAGADVRHVIESIFPLEQDPTTDVVETTDYKGLYKCRYRYICPSMKTGYPRIVEGLNVRDAETQYILEIKHPFIRNHINDNSRAFYEKCTVSLGYDCAHDVLNIVNSLVISTPQCFGMDEHRLEIWKNSIEQLLADSASIDSYHDIRRSVHGALQSHCYYEPLSDLELFYTIYILDEYTGADHCTLFCHSNLLSGSTACSVVERRFPYRYDNELGIARYSDSSYINDNTAPFVQQIRGNARNTYYSVDLYIRYNMAERTLDPRSLGKLTHALGAKHSYMLAHHIVRFINRNTVTLNRMTNADVMRSRESLISAINWELISKCSSLRNKCIKSVVRLAYKYGDRDTINKLPTRIRSEINILLTYYRNVQPEYCTH